MRHRKANRKLSRPTDQRIALLRGLAASLISNKVIKTTDTRAKEAQKFVERLITLGKKGDVHARRQALKLIPNKKVVQELFNNVAKRYQSRKGGYSRIVKLGFRRGDAAPVSQLELVD